MNITEFLLARISEDESRYPRPTGARKSGKTFWLRQQAECEAKRRIIALYAKPEDAYAPGRYTTDAVLRALTLPYTNHPDFDPSWGQ